MNTTTKESGISSYSAAGYQLNAGVIQDASLNKFTETLETLLKAANLSKYHVTVRPVPVSSDQGQNVSYLLIECADKATNPTAVGYTAVVIASSYSQPVLPTARYNVRHTNGVVDQGVEIRLADSDVCDRALLELMALRVQNLNSSVNSSRIYLAEPNVLPRTFNFNDPEQIRKVLINAINAASLRLNTSIGDETGFRDFTLANRTARGTEDVEVVMTDDPSINDNGLPLRADLRVLIQTAAKNVDTRNTRVSINGDNASALIAEVTAFADLTWQCDMTPQNTMLTQLTGGVQAGVTQAPKMYRPRVVFTRVRTQSISSLPMQLLTFATAVKALDVEDGRRLREYFVTATKSSNNIYRDLAGIGYELVPLVQPGRAPQLLETKGEAATAQQLMGLLQQVFHEPVYSIDIPEYGPESWTLTPFLSAASGNEVALREIVAAADWLTNGEFTKQCQAKHSGRYPTPVLNDNNRVHAGFYSDARTNQLVDIRSIDYLMVVNLFGENSPMEVTAWSQSYAASQTSLEQRVAKRWDLITAITANSAVQTGWYRRVTFGGLFLRTLMDAISLCDFSPNVRDNQQFTDQLRTNASFLNDGVVGGGGQFFNQNGGSNQNRNGMGGMHTRFENFL